MNRKPNSAQLLQRLPKKWTVAIVLVLVGYALFQPLANRQLGWNLPSIAGLLQQAPDGSHSQASTEPSSSPPPQVDSNSGRPASDVVAEPELSSTVTNEDHRGAAPDSGANLDGQLLYGLLREVGPEHFVSPGGLHYTRGSTEGHRLKHLQRHLKDQPDRPGSHGVFDGDMPQVLRWLDEAYQRASAGAQDTKRRQEDDRTVYEVTFDQSIGYVGGRTGQRRGTPEATRLRLVVEGDRVITAFPF